jgi:hypothetical protein
MQRLVALTALPVGRGPAGAPRRVEIALIRTAGWSRVRPRR